jgi:hypothetical protein
MRARYHGETVIAPNEKANAAPTVGFMFDALSADPLNRLPETPEAVSALAALGQAMTTGQGPAGDSAIPAAYTYFGQFIDHDITKTAVDASLSTPPGSDPIANPGQLKPVAADKIPMPVVGCQPVSNRVETTQNRSRGKFRIDANSRKKQGLTHQFC